MMVARLLRSITALVLAAFVLFFFEGAISGWAFTGIASETPPAKSSNSKSVHSAYLAGKMLVAAPKMADPRFSKTVIFMINHDSEGALGLIINQVLGKGSMAELLKGLNLNAEGITGDILLHYGGPVEPGAGFILHTTDYFQPGAEPPSTTILGKVAFTTKLEMLKNIAAGKGPRKSMILFGYAGWGPRQLEDEIDRDDWATAPADPDLIFGENQETKWDRARAKAGRAL